MVIYIITSGHLANLFKLQSGGRVNFDFRKRIACPDDAGHHDINSCETREFSVIYKL